MASFLRLGFLFDVERRWVVLGVDDERPGVSTTPGFDLISVCEAQQAVPPDPVLAERHTMLPATLGRKLDATALVFDAVVAELHPAGAEVASGHAMTVVLDRQGSANFFRNDDRDFGCAGIPGIGDQLGERGLAVVADLPECAQNIIVLEQGLVHGLIAASFRHHSSKSGKPLSAHDYACLVWGSQLG